MNIKLDGPQRELQSEVRAFVAEHIAPQAETIDRQQEFPRDLAIEIARAGYLGSHVSEEYGGRGLDMPSYGLLHEEIGKVCSSARTLPTVHDMVAEAIFRLGSNEMKRAWLPGLTSGEKLAAFALTEPEAGSDAASIQTVAVKSPTGYTLNGLKKWVSFGQIADVFLVVARAGKNGPPLGLLVPKDTHGLSIMPQRGMLGLRGSMLATLHFEDCPVTADSCIGSAALPPGLLVGTCLHLGRYSVAWGCVAIGEACVGASYRYAGERTQFGVPLEQHQLIRRMLANMLVDTRASRLLCLQAGYLRDTGDAGAVQATLVAKYFASRAANRTASDAVQIHGALGVSDHKPVERYFRDARIMEIIEGSTEIQQIAIAKYGVNEYRRAEC